MLFISNLQEDHFCLLILNVRRNRFAEMVQRGIEGAMSGRCRSAARRDELVSGVLIGSSKLGWADAKTSRDALTGHAEKLYEPPNCEERSRAE